MEIAYCAPPDTGDGSKSSNNDVNKKKKLPGLAGLRILVIEDEPLQALFVAQMIIELGAEVAGVATSIPAALAEMSEKTFDCVTLDLNMGGMFSLGMSRGLRDMGVPYVFCTAYGDVIDGLADAPVIKKPVTEEALAEGLLKALGRR